MVESRAGSAKLAGLQLSSTAKKRSLVFNGASGTERSCHAELPARNHRLCVHYLLEPGWTADSAIQASARINYTNQAQTPRFRSIRTDVKAESAF